MGQRHYVFSCLPICAYDTCIQRHSQPACHRLLLNDNNLIVFFIWKSFLFNWFTGLPSVLWCCWLGSRKGIRPVKTEWWGAGVVVCLEIGADLHMAQLMPLPLTVSCFGKIQIDFTFLVPAHLCRPGQSADKQMCVCVWFTGSWASLSTVVLWNFQNCEMRMFYHRLLLFFVSQPVV